MPLLFKILLVNMLLIIFFMIHNYIYRKAHQETHTAYDLLNEVDNDIRKMRREAKLLEQDEQILKEKLEYIDSKTLFTDEDRKQAIEQEKDLTEKRKKQNEEHRHLFEQNEKRVDKAYNHTKNANRYNVLQVVVIAIILILIIINSVILWSTLVN